MTSRAALIWGLGPAAGRCSRPATRLSAALPRILAGHPAFPPGITPTHPDATRTTQWRHLASEPSPNRGGSKGGRVGGGGGGLDPGALIRNIGVMAHIDAGKTTTTERMLFHAGVVKTIGSVDDGTTQMDFMAEERERGITIGSAVTTFHWNKHRVNLVDTPGHVDFTIEVERALRVLDGAVAVFDSTVGVQAQTLTVWRQAAKHAIPTVGFANKMDRDGSSLELTAASIRDKLGVTPLLLQVPVFERGDTGLRDDLVAVLDVVRMRRLAWDGVDTDSDVAPFDGGYRTQPLTPEHHGELYEAAVEGRAALGEALADLDDSFAERFLDADLLDPQALPPETFLATIRRLTLSTLAIPLLCGSARRTKGIQPLMDAVVDFLPSTLQRPPIALEAPARRQGKDRDVKSGDGGGSGTESPREVELLPVRAESLCALVFKIVFDPHRGPLAFVRVYSGVLRAKATLANSTQGGRERATKLLVVHADHHVEVDEVEAGNIVAIAGLKEARTGDTLVGLKDAKTKDCRLKGIDCPEPVFTCSIEAASSADADALEEALGCVTREDPSVRVVHDGETGQLLLSGMGELHLEVVISRLRSHYRVDCTPGVMRVAFRERPGPDPISLTHEVQRTIGGREQAATVELTIERAEGAGKPFVEFRGVKLDPEHEYAIREGIVAACSRGCVKGYPLMDVAVTVTAVEHDEQASAGVLAHCAAETVRRGLGQANVQMLHPLMLVEVTVDDQYVGDVLQDLGSERHASVLGIDHVTGTTRVVRAEAALSSLLGYNGALRRLTSGTATFTMEYLRHSEMSEYDVENMPH